MPWISMRWRVLIVPSSSRIWASCSWQQCASSMCPAGPHLVFAKFAELRFLSPVQVLYNGMQENNCSEQASRMSAMENSTKNASEILDKLTLSYNRSGYNRGPHWSLLWLHNALC